MRWEFRTHEEKIKNKSVLVKTHDNEQIVVLAADATVMIQARYAYSMSRSGKARP